MRIESSVTSLSWIPSEAVTGPTGKTMFGSEIMHYDQPPPDRIDDLAALRAADRFRFGNHLAAFIEVVDGRIIGADYCGQSRMGSTTVRLAAKEATFEAVALDELREPPEIGATSVRFVQTFGGRTALPAPRRVNRPPFVQFRAPTVWTTLALTLHTDGHTEFELVGASPFPRHWVYDGEGQLAAKAGLADYKHWYRTAFGKHTPWGDQNSAALVTAVETALERDLATTIMRGGEKPTIRKVKKGGTLTEQGAAGGELYLLLNGVLGVEVDGEPLAELGPGAVLGERAALEGGLRTSTLRALTRCVVASVAPDQIAPEALEELREGHDREVRSAE